MDAEFWRWAIPILLGALGFAFGSGWPAKTYRKWSDAQLFDRMDGRYVQQVMDDARWRENAMRHQRSDEVMGMLHDNQRAILALSGAVERHTEALKFFATDLQEVKEDVERLKEGRHDA